MADPVAAAAAAASLLLLDEEDDVDGEGDEMDYADENEREKALLKRQIAKLATKVKELHNKLEEEASIREKAAQYGMSLLEDNRLLGTKIYELENQNEAYKVELDTCNMVSLRPVEGGSLIGLD